MDSSNMDWRQCYEGLETYDFSLISEINPSQYTELGRLPDLNPQQEIPEPEPEPKVETNNGHQLNQAAEPSPQPSRRGRRPMLTESERKEHRRESDRRYRQKQNNILASWKKQQEDLGKKARQRKSENDRMLHIHPESKPIQHLEAELREIKSQTDVLMSYVQRETMITEWLAHQPCNVTVPATAAEFSSQLEDNKESKIERELEGVAGARFASKCLQDSPALLREVEGVAGMSDWRRVVTEVVQSGGDGSHSTWEEGDSPPSKKAKITSSISSSDKGKGKLVVPSSTEVCVNSPTFGDICLRAADELARNVLKNPNEIATAIAHVGGDLGMNTAVRCVNHEGLTQAWKEAVKEAASALFKMSNICDTVEKDFSHHSDLSAKLKASETKVIELQSELDARDKKISELEKSKVHLEGRVEHYRESFNKSEASLKQSALKMFLESSAFRAAAADNSSVFIDIGLRCAIEVAETFPAASFLTYEALNKAMAEEKGPVLAFLRQTVRHWITHDSLPPYSKNKGILIGGPDPPTPRCFAALLQSSTSATGTSASPAKVSTKTVTKGAKVVDVEGDDGVRGVEEGALQEQAPQKADEGDEPGKDDL